MSRPESDFPTIKDLCAGLSRLIDKGLGDLPVQLVIVPSSTMQAIARDVGVTGAKPVHMIELGDENAAERLPVTIMSTDALNPGASYSKTQ